jgi:hypothetical protein
MVEDNKETGASTTWKCRECGAEEISVKPCRCPYKKDPYDEGHGYMDPKKSFSREDLHNIDYGKPAV